MIVHADMPCFSNYRIFLRGKEITRPCYMADDVHNVVILRFAGPQGQGYTYERKTGKVRIVLQPETT